MRARSRVGLPLAAVLLLSACGSTVATTNAGGPLQQGQPGFNAAPGAGSPAADGLGGPAVTAPGGTTGGSTGSTGSTGTFTGTTGGTTGTGVGGSTTGTTGGPAGSGTTGGTSAQGVGPGVTATEIRLGIPYCSDCAAANAALGAGGEDPGDTRRYAQAALDDVNSRGGVLGRKLVPVWHEISASDNIEASQQEACETFTKDNKVLMIFFRGEITYECGKKAGIVVSGDSGSGPVFARYPNMFAAAGMRFERLAAVTVKAMVQAGWHKPDTKWPTGKIGIVSWDNTDYRYAMDKGWLPAMREAGLAAPLVKWVAIPQSDKGIADAGPAISSAVLAFRQAGIDHVFIADGPAGIFTGAGLTLLFLQNAKSQNYYPRYGFNTNNAPDFSSHPQDQLVGMIAIDSFDTAATNDAGIALNPQRERCFAIMRKKGLPVAQAQTQQVAIGSCEYAWFAEAIIERAGGTLLSQMIAGGEALGTSYRSPYNYGNRIGPGQHDGVALFRNLMMDAGCSCLKYTSKPYEP
ncbi:MAG: ABC transporter substrate-binding protein [Frankiaceae bacterium]|nr:ABC transporter substrate-binding protein [Frankiaceae bacterium]